MLELNKNFIDKKNRFIKRIENNFEMDKISKRLEKFYKMDFKRFLDELSKNKVRLNLDQQDEWEDYFNKYKANILDLIKKISLLEDEINQMVYNLYGLNKKEIELINETLSN